MKKSLTEFELDLEKMPLGKLSLAQLKRAYGVLDELLKHVEVGKTDFCLVYSPIKT